MRSLFIYNLRIWSTCARARGCRAVLQKRADCQSMENGMIYFSGQNRSIPRAHACRGAPGDAGDGDSLHLMMEWRPSRSHGRGGQRTPYLRQTSSVCSCRCRGRCTTCPASKYDAPGVLGHRRHLQLPLVERPSLPLRPRPTLPSPCTHATAGHKDLMY